MKMAEINEIIPLGFPSEKIVSPRAWNKNSNLGKIVHEFSRETSEEVKAYVQLQVPKKPLTWEDIESVDYNPNKLPSLANEIECVRPQVNDGIGFVVFPEWSNLNVHESRVASWLVASAFGEPKIQDDLASRLIEIYCVSDDLSMKTGARYHVTREGNSPHTDAPQVKEDPD